MTNGQQPISRPWFVVGCVLTLVAIVAFFWGFALKDLTSSQWSLLMWLLPLSSGFACGCFAGSMHAGGTVGTLTISAVGGFAVWLLTFYLLPSPIPAKPPDSLSMVFKEGTSIRQAA